jgi:hypothetical protein
MAAPAFLIVVATFEMARGQVPPPPPAGGGPALSEGKTLAADARKIAALVAIAPVDVKPAGQALLQAAQGAVKQVTDALRALNLRLKQGAERAIADATRLLEPRQLQMQITAAAAAGAAGSAADPVGTYVETSINTAIAHAQQTLTAAKDEATKIVSAVEAAVQPAQTQAEGLSTRGAPLVELAKSFVLAAKRQAARVLWMARQLVQDAIGQIQARGKRALAASAGTPKAFIARLRQAAQKNVQEVAVAAARLVGPAKEVATQLSDKMSEVSRTFAAAIRTARQQFRSGQAGALSEALGQLNVSAMKSTHESQGAGAAQEFETKVRDVVTRATTVVKQTVTDAREAIRQAIDNASAMLTPFEAQLAPLGAAAAPLVQKLRMLLASMRQEGVRTVLRASLAAKKILARVANESREAVTRAVGKEPLPSVGLRPAVASLLALVGQLPPAVRQPALLAAGFARRAADKALADSRRLVRAAGALVSRAERDAQAAVSGIRSIVANPQQAATALKARVTTLMRSVSQAFLQPIRQARATAKMIVQEAEAAFQKIAIVVQPLGRAASAFSMAARKVANAARKEAALLVRTVRTLAKSATRAALKSARGSVNAMLGVRPPPPSGLRVSIEAYRAALRRAPASVRRAGEMAEALLVDERREIKSKMGLEASELKTAQRTAREAAESAIVRLVQTLRSTPPKGSKPVEAVDQAGDILKAAKARILAVLAKAKNNAKTYASTASRRATQVASILGPTGSAGKALLAAAKHFADEIRVRIGRNLLRLQDSARKAIRRVVTMARARLRKLVPGAVAKRSEGIERVRALKTLLRAAPKTVREAAAPMVDAIKKVLTAFADATANARKSIKTALADARKTAGAKPTPASTKEAMTGLATHGKKLITETQEKATQVATDADALAKDAEEKVGEVKDPAMTKVVALVKKIARATKRDAARLVLGARKNARRSIKRLLQIIKRGEGLASAKPGKASPRKTPEKAPKTKGAPAKPPTKPVRPAVNPKKAGFFAEPSPRAFAEVRR